MFTDSSPHPTLSNYLKITVFLYMFLRFELRDYY